MNPEGALILVDLQQGFLARPGLEPHRDTIVAGAVRWLTEARTAGRPVAHVRTECRPGDPVMVHWSGAAASAWKPGEPATLFAAGLEPLPGEPIFSKNGYLPADPSAVARWVRGAGQARVLLGGVMTHACVAHLAAALLGEGLEVGWAGGALGSDRPQTAAQIRVHLAAKGVREYFPGVENGPDDPAPADEAVARALRAWHGPEWSWPERQRALLAWAGLMERDAEPLARRITDSVAKPITMALQEVRAAAALVRDAVRWCREWEHARRGPDGLSVTRPHGVVAVLTPWNNPVSIPVGRIAPGLAFGNAVVWKPSPAGRAPADHLRALAKEAGWPEGWLVCCAGGAEAGARLASHPDVAAVAFSGSLARGREVLAACAERLAPCQLEMGGNNAAVIAESADPGEAAEAVLAGAFSFAGQRCTANRRVVVLPGVKEKFLRALHEGLVRWQPGDPRDPACRIGPVKDEEAARRMEELLARAVAAGARVTRAPAGTGPAMVAPAVVEGAEADAEIVREETFGPVLVVEEAADFEAALARVDAVPQGLAAAVFTRDDAEWERFRRTVRAGVLRRNSATAGAVGDLPFGGWKASGWGPAEHAEADREFFTRRQAWIHTETKL